MGAPGRIGSTVGRLGLAAGTSLLLLLGCSSIAAMNTRVHDGSTLGGSIPDSQLGLLAAGYRPGGTLGFTLRETAITATGAARGG